MFSRVEQFRGTMDHLATRQVPLRFLFGLRDGLTRTRYPKNVSDVQLHACPHIILLLAAVGFAPFAR